MNMLDISVVLPCYNAQSTLVETLDSINAQSFVEFEVIIINDGSTDKTSEILSNYKFREKIEVKIVTRSNKGFLASLVEGVKLSRGSFIARIDSDDIWFPNHLQLIMNKFHEDSHYVLIGSNAVNIDEKKNIISRTHLPLRNESILKFMLKDNPFVHSSVVFKKDTYFKTGGYICGEGDFYKHIADYNLWFELSKFGKCENIEKPTLFYRVLDSSMSRTINKVVNYKARQYVMKKVYKTYHNFFLYFILNYFATNVKILQSYLCR